MLHGFRAFAVAAFGASIGARADGVVAASGSIYVDIRYIEREPDLSATVSRGRAARHRAALDAVVSGFVAAGGVR